MPELYPVRFDANGYSQGIDPRAAVASDRKPDNVRVLTARPADPRLLKLDASGEPVAITQTERDEYDAPETEAERAARLAPAHGTQVVTLVQCLAQFTDANGNQLSLPIELDDAISAMYAALETQPELTRHAMLAQTMYTALHGQGLADRDIYLISQVI